MMRARGPYAQGMCCNISQLHFTNFYEHIQDRTAWRYQLWQVHFLQTTIR
jgi:hypothetical protein